MRHATWLSAPFAQPTKAEPSTPVERIMVAPGYDHSLIAFRSDLLRREVDGEELRNGFDRMAERAPRVAAQVVRAGSLGRSIMWDRAVDSLRTYLDTAVATAPMVV